MLRRLSRFALVCAVASSIGLHWAFFQAVAWTNMVACFARDTTFVQALVKTFDGKHPCALCKRIAEGKRTEKKSPRQLELKKFEFPCLEPTITFIHSEPYTLIQGQLLSARLVPFTPPVPPPRLLA